MSHMKSSVLVAPSEGRRRNMAAIRSKNTKPEIYVRRHVHAAGFRFRLHRRDLPGRPDLVFPRFRLAVFVHGCFWHGHECSRGNRPRTNVAYWGPKIQGNQKRDRHNAELLRQGCWSIVTIRECTVERDTDMLLRHLKILRARTGGDNC